MKKLKMFLCGLLRGHDRTLDVINRDACLLACKRCGGSWIWYERNGVVYEVRTDF